ncbi:hypothetical protein C8Q76DRAFT_708943 [Earliella scabrosa]|nr:hypothetical protein C8Q76DRAFT_708943 [Earliella scabrosa]
MILPDNTPSSPTKSRAGPPSEVPEDDVHSLPPPAYPGHSSSSVPIPSPQNVDIEAQAEASNSRTPLVQPHPRPEHHIEQVEPAPRRFLKAFGIAVLIYLVAGSFTRTVIAGSKSHSNLLPLPKRSDGTVHSCVLASSYRSVPASFNLPVSADALYIFSRGNFARGSVTLMPAHDSSIPEDTVRVDIVPSSSSEAALGLANICVLERARGQQGIGILTPTYQLPTADISFDITVQIPIPSYGPLHMKAFETRLPLFSHEISLGPEAISFGSLVLSSENMAIHSDYVQADEAVIRTSNAKISGSYRAYKSLVLQTTNDAVAGHLSLYHDSKRAEPTALTINAPNSPIDTSINLRSTSSYSTGGTFSVTAHTQNRPIEMRFDEQPTDSVLVLDAETANAPAHVNVHPAYEGTVELATTHGQMEMAVEFRARDPAGRGRKRAFDLLRQTAFNVKGRLWWTKGGMGQGAGRGSVVVKSENAPVRVAA